MQCRSGQCGGARGGGAECRVRGGGRGGRGLASICNGVAVTKEQRGSSPSPSRLPPPRLLASSPPRLLCSALQQAVSGSYTPLPPLARVPPPRLFPRLRSPAVTHYSLTNSLTHALTHSLTHCTIHSHSRSLTRFSLRSPFTQIIQLVRS